MFKFVYLKYNMRADPVSNACLNFDFSEIPAISYILECFYREQIVLLFKGRVHKEDVQ